MSKEQDFTPEGQAILQQRIIAAQTLAGSGTNAHQALNTSRLMNSKIAQNRAYYDKRGQTLPASAVALMLDASRTANHSRTLARNINKSTGQVRPQDVAAHHIVASRDYRADQARRYLFAWGIAINDSDNGVYLPRYTSSIVPSMPNAIPHDRLHTTSYYLEVNLRLFAVRKQAVSIGRLALQTIKQELISGSFPY